MFVSFTLNLLGLIRLLARRVRCLQLWDITLARAKRRAFSCLTGELGQPRAFHIGDLILCLQQSRLTRNAYDDLFRQPL
jgi:hypothetical protein